MSSKGRWQRGTDGVELIDRGKPYRLQEMIFMHERVSEGRFVDISTTDLRLNDYEDGEPRTGYMVGYRAANPVKGPAMVDYSRSLDSFGNPLVIEYVNAKSIGDFFGLR